MFIATQNKSAHSVSVFFLMTASVLLFSLVTTAQAAISVGEWQPVSGATVSKSDRVYDTANRVYYTLNKITNNNSVPINGPLRLVVTSSSYPVTNAAGTDANGKPYFNALADGASLAGGATGSAIRINFQNTRATFAYTVEVQKFVTQDSDGDGIVNAVDTCPLDAKNDEDSDGVCGDVDSCPLDPQNDADGDGLCANDDICPTNASNSCVTINGQVFGDGAALTGANIKIGSLANHKTAVTDNIGKFTVTGLGSAQFANDNLNDFLPVEALAPGYASGYAKVLFEPGKNSYLVIINLQSVSRYFTFEDDLTQGVEIYKAGEIVGQLTIPENALPAGVTATAGAVTYLDPGTSDIRLGPELLALPQGSDPNATPTSLESYGMMEIDLRDQNGNPVHELGGNAEVCMKATPSLSAGDTIPLWYYDAATGLWKEEGQGMVVTKHVNGADILMICGNVTHFSWWNVDRPIPPDTYSCFKFDFREEITGKRLNIDLAWQAEAVTYTGANSYERACSVDGNDPIDVGQTIDSFTVKKSSDTKTERVRVFTYYGGGPRVYLKRDGDGTYSLTYKEAEASLFDTPVANASCSANSNVEQCAFLDYQDISPDGILPLSLSNVNKPPYLSNFSASSSKLLSGASMPVSVTVTDFEGAPVSVAWTTKCGWNGQLNSGGSISPSTQGPSASPAVANATFTAPATQTYPQEFCSITVTATDSDGKSTTASTSVEVLGILNVNGDFLLEGTLYGTDGQPMPYKPFQYLYGSCNQMLMTNAAGQYSIEPSPGDCSLGLSISGEMHIDYTYNNINITRYENLNERHQYSCTEWLYGDQQCHYDIRLPTVWGPLSGDLYMEEGSPITKFEINSRFADRASSDSFNLFPAQNDTHYGPVSVPIGSTVQLNVGTSSNEIYFSTTTHMPSTEGQRQDIGLVKAPVTVKVLNGYGEPIVDWPVWLFNYFDNGVSGNTNTQGEFTGALWLGIFAAQVNSTAGHYSYGYTTTKDQPVYIDANSTDHCTVSGVAYFKGKPLGPNVIINAIADFGQSSGIIDENNGKLEAVTDANGHFKFTGVPAGLFYLNRITNFSDNNPQSSFAIDNCRPVGGVTRDIRFDIQYDYVLPPLVFQ